jgi:hypothetical protein
MEFLENTVIILSESESQISNKVSDTKTYFLTTGINDLIVPTSVLTVYPNPVFNSLTVKLNCEESQILELNIFDVSGKMVEKVVPTQLHEINV